MSWKSSSPIAGVAGTLRQPDQVLGVVVAVDRHRRGRERREGRGRPRLVLGGEVGRRRAAGRRRQVPFERQPRLAQQEGEVVGRRRPGAVGRRQPLQVGEEVDRRGVEPALARRRRGAEPGEEVVAEVLEQHEAAVRVGGEHRRRAEAGGAQPGVDREERPDGQARPGRHVHQDRPRTPARQPLVAPRRGVAGQRRARAAPPQPSAARKPAISSARVIGSPPGRRGARAAHFFPMRRVA